MGDGVSDFSPSFGGWGVGVLSPTGSAGQMDALCQGVRADALIWADGLAQQPTPAKGHLEKHKKGAGENEEEEEEMPSSSLATLAHLPKASATLARAEAEVAKPATDFPSMGPCPDPHGCLSGGCRSQSEEEAPEKQVQLEGIQGKEPKSRFIFEGCPAEGEPKRPWLRMLMGTDRREDTLGWQSD